MLYYEDIKLRRRRRGMYRRESRAIYALLGRSTISYGRKEVTSRHVLPYSIGGRLVEEEKKRRET